MDSLSSTPRRKGGTHSKRDDSSDGEYQQPQLVSPRSKKRRLEKSSSEEPNLMIVPMIEIDKIAYYKRRQQQTEELAQERLTEEQELAEREEREDSARVCWKNINGDDERCQVLTGFTCLQFAHLLALCEPVIPVVLGRGRRSKWSAADKLLLLLCYLKHYETQSKLGETFLISKPQVNRIIYELLPCISNELYRYYVIELASRLSDRLPSVNEIFREATLVMDATVQQIWVPIGSFEEKKQYYSGKHKKYCLKSLTLHNRQGLLIRCWAGTPGAVHDITVAMNNLAEINGLIGAGLDSTRRILADSGFIGLSQVIHPYKRTPKKDLTLEQREFNTRLATQRVICERWYARLKRRCRIMAETYHNDRDVYANYFRLCAALTNLHILSNPL